MSLWEAMWTIPWRIAWYRIAGRSRIISTVEKKVPKKKLTGTNEIEMRRVR